MPVNSTGTCCSHPSKHCSIRRIWAPGFRIDEITNPSDAYTASTNLHAGFIQFDNLVHKNIRLVWGVRVENFIQKLNSFGYSNDTIRVRENYTDLLPSINVSWSLSEKTNLRIAASNRRTS